MKLPSRTVPDLASQLNFEKLERTVDSEPVTSLPTTDLYVGRRIVYVADAANGVHWDLVLTDPNATYPWAAVNGPPLFNEVVTTESTTSATYGALATAGPSITVPLAGDYYVETGARMNNDAANQAAAMSYDIGGTGAVDADYITSIQGTGISANNIYRRRRKTGLAASTALVAKYKRVGGVTAYSEARWMSVVPIRVG